MTEKLVNLALDIVGKFVFGYPLHAQTREENRFVSKALAFGAYRGNVWHYLFFLSKLYPNGVIDRLVFGFRERYSALFGKMIKARVGLGRDGEKDFYSFISETGSGTDGVRLGELWGEANLLLIAGQFQFRFSYTPNPTYAVHVNLYIETKPNTNKLNPSPA